MIGKIFQNQYKVIKQIGQGEFSDVYLGHDLKKEREIAIKVETKGNYLLKEAKLMNMFREGTGINLTKVFPN